MLTTAIAVRIWHSGLSGPFLKALGWQRLKVSDLSLSNFNFQETEANSAGVSVDYAPYGSHISVVSQNVTFPLRKWSIPSAKVDLNTKFPAVEANNRLWITPRFESGPYFFSPSQITKTGSQVREQTDDLVLRRANFHVKHVEDAVYCGTRVPKNWGHWLMNFLPGVMLAAEQFPTDASPPLIVPPGYREGQSREQLFDLIWGQRPVIAIEPTTTYEVENLHWFEQPISDSPRPTEKVRLKPKTVNIAALTRFRRKILDFAGLAVDGPEPTRNIFLARESGSSREYDYGRVHMTASNFGFEVVFLNRLEIIDQIRLVHSAKKIVAPDGSALASLLFSHPSSNAIVLTRFDDTEDWFAFGAAISGSSAQAIRHSGHAGQPWDLDPKLLEAALTAG